MKIPVIKHLTEFAENNDADFLEETIQVLEDLWDFPCVNVYLFFFIGVLICNLYGALEVQKAMEEGTSKKDALNGFMKRVLGSIDK